MATEDNPRNLPAVPDRVAFRNKLVLTSRAPELRNRIVAVAGRKGSGKSTVTKHLLGRNNRLFIYDTMGEHSWVPDRETDLAIAELYVFERGASTGDFRGSFIAEDDDTEGDFSTICNAVYEAGNMTFAVEELPMLSAPNYVPPRFDRLIRLGRHRCVNILYTGQRLSECPRRVTAATDVFVLFSHTEPRDLEAIAERCDPSVATMVARLGEHEFLVWDVASRQVVVVDNGWYDAVLNGQQEYTPAIGGKYGRPALWSLDDGD